MGEKRFEGILALQKEVSALPQPDPVTGDAAYRAFVPLLAGVSALRRTPGLSDQADLSDVEEGHFTTLPLCTDDQRAAQTRQHLKQVYGISDQGDLIDFCQGQLQVHRQYLDFESFWEGRPNFPLSELNSGGLAAFTACRDFAQPLWPIVGRRGFLAWDISETIGLLAVARACGILTDAAFWDLAAYWADQAAAFHSWGEFAVGLLCGHAYWSYCAGSGERLPADMDLYLNLVCQLLSDERAWKDRPWYLPGGKHYRFSDAELRPVLVDWEGPEGCLVSDRVAVDGAPVGFCYREEPAPGYPDSGWRFFAGDESPAYLEDAEHTSVLPLNTLCNYDPTVIPLLHAPAGISYIRDAGGVFRAESSSRGDGLNEGEIKP